MNNYYREYLNSTMGNQKKTVILSKYTPKGRNKYSERD